MNIYEKSFHAGCPSDNDIINYHLTISSESKIYVEHINTACKLLGSRYHEDIADILHSQFGGVQEIVAVHQGVQITTIRN